MENTYYETLKRIIMRSDDTYKYPGEMMERCVMNGGKDKDLILNAFEETAYQRNGLEALLNFPDGFNTDQIDRFVGLFKGSKSAFDAQMLRYDLTGQISLLAVDEISTPEEYVQLVNYIQKVQKTTNTEALSELNEQAKTHLHLLHGYSSSSTNSLKYNFMADWLYETSKNKMINWSKEDRQFIKLIYKASEAPLKTEEVESLKTYGFDELSARRLNVKAINTYTVGRKSKTAYEFLKQLLFGHIKAEETDWILADMLFTDHKTLDRAIDQENDLFALLCNNQFVKESANIKEAFTFLVSRRDRWGNLQLKSFNTVFLFEKIDYQTIFKELEPEHQKQLLIKRVETYAPSEKNKDLVIQNIRQWEHHFPEERITKKLSEGCLEHLIRKEILPMEEVLDENKNKIPEILCSLFEDPCALTAKAIKMYFYDFGKITSMPKKAASVEFKNATDEQIRELYDAKESVFYRYMPQSYSSFLANVIISTGEIIHTKKEWKELLPYLNVSGWEKESVRKAVYTAEDYEAMKAKEKAERYEADIQEQLKMIENAETASGVNWYRLTREDKRVVDAYFKKACETNSLDNTSTIENIVSLYMRNMIEEDVFFNYMRACKKKKEEKRKEKEREAAKTC